MISKSKLGEVTGSAFGYGTSSGQCPNQLFQGLKSAGRSADNDHVACVHRAPPFPSQPFDRVLRPSPLSSLALR